MRRLVNNTIFLFIALNWHPGATSLTGVAPLSVGTSFTQSAPLLSTNQRDRGSIASQLPHAVFFREVKGRGLLVKTWINGSGPFTFAIDTGAGITLIAERVAATALLVRGGTSVSVAGLSGVSQSTRAAQGTATNIRTLAIGDSENFVAANQRAVIISTMPSDIDGILDPTEAYSPFGYSIDLPHHELSAFNPKTDPLSIQSIPAGGTVVRWLDAGSDRRPFIRLNDGRLVLLDTGSGFGLALSEGFASARSGNRGSTRQDLGGGEVRSSSGDPSTISIGALTLRGVPTDLLEEREKGVPVLLGRGALYPFRLTFDPLRHLIAIAPVER